jgi:hypothetical protein
MDDEDQFADEHEFCCGKPRRCPRASLQSDGVVLSVTHAEKLDGADRVGMKFDADQARDLYKWLKAKGFDR